LRPTPDRLRETLFNWLQADIEGARCLDLFAGTGVLGLEAASRGAADVLLVERDPRAASAISASLRLLGADNVSLRRADAFAMLETRGRPYDLVFLDPPYGHGLAPRCLRALVAGGWLRPGARVYVETEAAAGAPETATGWALVRKSRVGDAEGRLLSCPGSECQG
jgi:16S rRNA (guanine966-N2)-methyltransferase